MLLLIAALPLQARAVDSFLDTNPKAPDAIPYGREPRPLAPTVAATPAATPGVPAR